MHLRQQLPVFGRRGRREPAAVAAHDLVDDEHARVRVVLGHHVGKEMRALLGCRPRAETLADGDDVVVNRLGQADDGEIVIVRLEEFREVGGGGVRVVAADGVQHVHAVLDQLVGGHLLRVLAFLDEAALHAILHVGELHAAVADGAAAVLHEGLPILAHRGRHRQALALQQAHVAVHVADDFHIRRLARVGFNQITDGGAQARSQAASGQDSDFFNFGMHKSCSADCAPPESRGTLKAGSSGCNFGERKSFRSFPEAQICERI